VIPAPVGLDKIVGSCLFTVTLVGGNAGVLRAAGGTLVPPAARKTLHSSPPG